jgi:hypothetical protein
MLSLGWIPGLLLFGLLFDTQRLIGHIAGGGFSVGVGIQAGTPTLLVSVVGGGV